MITLRRHPSSQKLGRWVQTSQPERVGDHVARCERCTVVLDSEHRLTDRQRRVLMDATEPPADLETTMTSLVTDRVRRRQALAAVADLFTLGWQTPRVVFESPPEGEQ
jgi:hypothetical protein